MIEYALIAWGIVASGLAIYWYREAREYKNRYEYWVRYLDALRRDRH